MRLMYVVIVLNVDSPFVVNCLECNFVVLLMSYLNNVFIILLTLFV